MGGSIVGNNTKKKIRKLQNDNTQKPGTLVKSPSPNSGYFHQFSNTKK